MLKIQAIFWLLLFTVSHLFVTARPRNSTQTAEPCGSSIHLTDPQGKISSGNFTGPYPTNTSCTWIITLPQTSNLLLRFNSFYVYSSVKHCGGTKCRCDFLQLKELDPEKNSTGFNEKFCNDFPPKKVYNLRSRVRIRFVSHSLKEKEFEFSLSYKGTVLSRSMPKGSDFVPAKAALRSGIGSGAKLPVNQTLAATSEPAKNITDTLTQRKYPQNSTSSEVDVPLSAFTSKAPVNFQLTSETTVLPSVEQSGPTSLPRTFVPPGTKTQERIWTNPVHIVNAVEQEEVEETVPDIIVLGPSVPVVMIFVLVVVGIAWWNYKFNSEELNRYESYAQSNKAKRHKKHLKNISKGNLYNRMTKDWRGQSFSVKTRASPMVGKKISFAGKLREGIRTPRPSPAHSEETMPLTKPATATPAFLSPDAAPSSVGSRPGSRPASLLLRDALINMLSGTETGETPSSGPASKRASKRVSFINEDAGQPQLKHEPSLPEKELHIPAILVRHPSDDAVDRTAIPPEEPRDPGQEYREPEVFFEDESYLEGASSQNDTEGSSSWDGRHEGDYPESIPEEIPERSLIFPDLEDFLLNLDKDSLGDSPPYSCEGHIRDILRKSYGEEALSSLGPNTILSVPDEFLGMVRGSSQSTDKAISDSDRVDDVD